VNARNALSETCLHEAAQLGQFDVVVLLLLVKADSTAKDNRNMRPMDVARLNNHEETVAVLKRDMIKHAAYARFGDEAEESGQTDETESESESDADLLVKEPNQATQSIVQKMKPLLRGVQGAVNTLFPLKTPLGDNVQFTYDNDNNCWVTPR